MTLSEVLELREREPRAFNAAVATALGWERGTLNWPHWGYPPGAKHERVNSCQIPRYADDPAADLEAHRAACQWEDDRATKYNDALWEILNRRWKVQRPKEVEGYHRVMGEECFDVWLIRYYVVGDYAAAALVAVEEMP